MKQVYKKESFLWNIPKIIFFSLFFIFCLYGAKVYASTDDYTINYLDTTFENLPDDFVNANYHVILLAHYAYNQGYYNFYFFASDDKITVNYYFPYSANTNTGQTIVSCEGDMTYFACNSVYSCTTVDCSDQTLGTCSYNPYTFNMGNLNYLADYKTIFAPENYVNNFVAYCNVDFYDGNEDTLIYEYRENPEITTSLSDLESLSFSYLSVEAHDYSNEDIYLLVYDRSGTEATLERLYPRKSILLNTSCNYYNYEESGIYNAFYSIPIERLGVTYEIGGNYGFRFATRYWDEEYSTYVYNYLGDYVSFTVLDDLSQDLIDEINSEVDKVNEEELTQQIIDSQQQTTDAINNQTSAIEEQTGAINSQTEQQQQQYSDFTNTDVSDDDDSLINDTMSSISSSTDELDETDYTNLFSYLFEKFYSVVSDASYDSVSTITIYLPFVNNGGIVLSSDLLSNLLGNILGGIVKVFWYFAFGMYVFRFAYGLVKKIKSGEILNGYSNSNEVITSTML